jgi:hypothetical protein
MAEYYPLIARAVGGLEDKSGEKRRALYERARAALLAQLRNADPPLDESQITRERLALEEAIRRVEAETAKAEEAQASGEAAPSLRDQALRDFRVSVAEAEGLGSAASDANTNMRVAYEQVREPSSSPLPPPRSSPPRRPSRETHLFDPPTEEPPPDLTPGEPASKEPPETVDEFYKKAPIDWQRFVPLAVILLIVAVVAGGIYWQRHAIGNMIASLRSTPQTMTPPAQEPAPPGTPKIADRIGPSSNGLPAPATAPAAAVAQKVVLYDEDPNDPQGKRYVGSVIWKTETISPGPGLAPELAVRADVEIPERRMRMTWSLRRNTDKNLPASHTIEVMFTLPADFDEKGVNSVPGVLMKTTEQARGVPLAGLSVKVTNGYFLIGLSSVDVDVQRNVSLLKERDWFDIPIVYASGKRAILALEKGTPGQRAFAEAFRAWGE